MFGEPLKHPPMPRPNELGPDPEPLGSERLERLMARVEREQARTRLPSPERCPLARAPLPCGQRSCVFFHVPDVPAACAALYWSPDVAERPALSAWYRARRREAAAA